MRILTHLRGKRQGISQQTSGKEWLIFAQENAKDTREAEKSSKNRGERVFRAKAEVCLGAWTQQSKKR
jgi:hypothetical protein